MSNKALSLPLSGNWTFEGGNIRNSDDVTKGFGVQDGKISVGTKVNIDETLSANHPGQQWEKGVPDASGYYTIMNPNSKKFLTAVNIDKITIEGTINNKIILFF